MRPVCYESWSKLDQGEPVFSKKARAEGELLADRLARGPLPAEEALRYAIDLGSALSRAHARGVAHGHVSPYSVSISAAGAQLLEPPPQVDSGAAPYRSPEQVRGVEAGVPGDIFSFGAVLYEMSSGHRAFPGEGAELDREILEKAPAPLLGKSAAQAAMEGVVASCLQKDPGQRRQRIQTAVLELKLAARSWQTRPKPPALKPPVVTAAAQAAPVRAAEAASHPAANKAPDITTWRRLRVWVLAAAFIALAASGVAAVVLLRPRPAAPVLQFPVIPPENATYPGAPSISPDGRYVAFSAVGPDGQRGLWLRPLDELRSTPIAGTEGGSAPFWSPDSRNIGFFADRSLKKVALDSGTVEIVCAAETTPGGGTWGRNGTILFAPSLADGLYWVPSTGGAPRPVLKLNHERSEAAFLWPQFLPDNQRYLFFVLTDSAENTGVYVGSIDPPDYRMVLPSETNAVYCAGSAGQSSRSSYLLYMRDRSLMAQPVEPARLTSKGDPVTLAADIGAMRSLSLAPISVSNNAILAYQTIGDPTRQLVWMDRQGHQTALVKEPGDWGPPRISPDGTHAVAARFGAEKQTSDLWLVDTTGGISRLTDAPGRKGSPVWSADGSRIAFYASDKGDASLDLYTIPAVGGKPELLYKSDGAKLPTDWSRDGRFLLFGTVAAGTKTDVWALSLADRRAGPILNTVYSEKYAVFSPDGKWLAYQSDESGRSEVYVQRFDGIQAETRRRWQVSNAGGGAPRWRGDGKELFWLTPGGRMMAVEVHPSDSDFGMDAPATLFQTQLLPNVLWNLYDVSPDGQRFLVCLPLELSKSSNILVMTELDREIRRLSPH